MTSNSTQSTSPSQSSKDISSQGGYPNFNQLHSDKRSLSVFSDQSDDYEMTGYFKPGAEGKDRSISDSSIGSYFDPGKSQVQISTHQLLDQVYEKYMVNLPDDLLQAFKLAETTKVEIISELFGQRILQIEMEIAENESDTQFLQYQDEYKKQVLS